MIRSIYSISGELDANAIIYLSLDSEMIDTETGMIFPPRDGSYIIYANGFYPMHGIKFRPHRIGLDDHLCAEVILPYPWSKRALVCNRPVYYATKRGWVSGVVHWLLRRLKD